MNYSIIILVAIFVLTVWLSIVRFMIVTEMAPVYCHDAKKYFCEK